MKKNKKIIVMSALVLGLTAMGTTAARAAFTSTSTTTRVDPMSSLVTAISQKFNLNSADVQKVFDEQKTQMDLARQQEEKSRLDQAVTDGKITQDQANKITAKKAELEAYHTSIEGKTEQEEHALMRTQMDGLKQWATDNNIPMQYLFFFGGHDGTDHGDKGFAPDEMVTPLSTTTQ